MAGLQARARRMNECAEKEEERRIWKRQKVDFFGLEPVLTAFISCSLCVDSQCEIDEGDSGAATRGLRQPLRSY